MATAVNTTDGAAGGSAGQQISTGGYNYGQLGAGPAAELATILTQLLGLYETCMEDWAQMSANSSKVQALTANVSAEAQQAAAEDQSDATKAQAWQAGLSGGIALAQVGVEAGMTSSINTQIETQDTELQQMNELNTTVQNKMTTGAQDVEQQEEGVDNPARNPDVEARIQEMQAGNFTKSNVNYVRNSTETSIDEQSIKAANDDELPGIKEQLDTQISNKYQEINSLNIRKQQIMGYAQTFGQMANGLNGGIAQGVQSNYQAEQGTEQAISTTGNVASQMAGTSQGTSASAQNKAQEEITSAIQQFRAAAQAYPQG